MLVVAAESISARDRAFVFLMRHSGLAIQDAATLARERLEGTLLTLRRGKSGELVQVDLPAPVVTALASLPIDGPHFFWTGKSALATATKLWRHRLQSVAAAAKVANFHSHRLRDTFAAELLLADMAMGMSRSSSGTPAFRPQNATTRRGTAPAGTAWCGSCARPTGRIVSWKCSTRAELGVARGGAGRLVVTSLRPSLAAFGGTPNEFGGVPNSQLAAASLWVC